MLQGQAGKQALPHQQGVLLGYVLQVVDHLVGDLRADLQHRHSYEMRETHALTLPIMLFGMLRTGLLTQKCRRGALTDQHNMAVRRNDRP